MTTPRLHGVPSPESEQGQSARLSPAGFRDQLGDRTLSFNPVSETTVETLHLRREFAESLAFDGALRARVEKVGRLSNAGLANVQSVERTDKGLLLISKYASGRRLSELGSIDEGARFAFDVIRRVTPALAALHQATPGIGHGALSLNRIVMTRDKRLIVVEHVLASGLEALRWSRSRFNDLGLVVPDAVPVRLDERNDLRQLGWIVLSLLLGRDLPADDYPTRAESVLDEAHRSLDVLKFTKLGDWLGRVLQVAPDSFPNAQEAVTAFHEFSDDPMIAAAEEDGALSAFPSEESPEPAVQATTHEEAAPEPVAAAAPIPVLRPVERAPKPVAPPPSSPAVPAPVAAAASTLEAPAARPARAAAPVAPKPQVIARRQLITREGAIIIAGGLLAIGIIQSMTIATLMNRPPQAVVGGPPPQLLPEPPASGIDAASAAAATSTATPTPAPPAGTNAEQPPTGAAAATARPGRVNVQASIELEILRDNAVVGSSLSPLFLPGGQYTLVFANRAVGFRATQVVNVTNGQSTSVRIPIPRMLVSVNAVPWAEVTIDGAGYGQTPLANVSLSVGSHEFVFRHPEFGERRQTVVIRADVPNRVTESFR